MGIGDIYLLSIEGATAASANVFVNTFAYRQEDDAGIEGAIGLVSAWKDDVRLLFSSLFVDDIGLLRAVVKEAPTGLTLYEESLVGFTGVLTGDKVANQVAAILTLRTATPGRTGRGRIYVWPADETAMTNGIWTSAYLTAMGNLGAALVSSIASGTSSTYQAGVWSRLLSLFRPLTTTQAQPLPGVIRSRRL